MSQTKEVGKDLVYQHEKRRNHLYIKITLVVATAYFVASYLLPEDYMWFYNPFVLLEHYKEFYSYFTSVAVLLFSLWIYFYYNGKLKALFDYIAQILLLKGVGRLSEISRTMVYQQPTPNDGLKRPKRKLALFTKNNGASISKIFNFEDNNPTTSRIIRYFRSNQHYVDLFRIIEGYVNEPDDKEKQIDSLYDYNIQDEESSDKKRAAKARKERMRYRAFQDGMVHFSPGIVKKELNEITKDFERYIQETLSKPTSTRKSIKAMHKRERNKLVDVFAFVMFHRIITNFVNIPTGLVESKVDDYDFRRIINSYQVEGFTIELSKDNNGKNKSFSNDTFAAVFLTLFNKYMHDGSSDLDVKRILKKFDPLADVQEDEEKIFDIDMSKIEEI